MSAAFHDRMTAAQEHESAVIERLRNCGWHAFAFGQGLLPPALREILKRFKTPMRWMPDIVAARHPYDVFDLVFVDAKAGDKWRETGNHDVELASAESARGWAEYTKCSHQFVFADWTCASPTLLLKFGRQGQFRGSGSGTPFILISRDKGIPFDAIFGAPPDIAAHITRQAPDDLGLPADVEAS